ncbi:isoprenylcysteine carboxyl methyltransferase [Phlyctema vagabunda]|uniref:Protein-S-isoprenylcysteine O-methyltransferase n=1 Tax=Phlyctema vagabunda TaxID=108571 RepID=A0ABR4P1Y1_9HELO
MESSPEGVSSAHLGEHYSTLLPNQRGAAAHSTLRQLSNGGIGNGTTQQQVPGPRHEQPSINEALDVFEKQYAAGQAKSLSGIAGRAFLLGITLALAGTTTIWLLWRGETGLWRAPCFVALLALFHFLEFLTTAHYNTPAATITSFLLSSNGSAYTGAHTAALCECLLSYTFNLPNTSSLPLPLPLSLVGILLVVVGQAIRTIAMCQAGTNFNHVVQHRRNPTHRLVTDGIYAVLRHPSYFGFFWWGIGTQLVLGNVVCLLGYAAVLWKFFHARIQGEEELLCNFFGDEYTSYKKRTWVGIPLCG